MKKLLFVHFFLFFCFFNSLIGQPKVYFQQKVDFDIEVQLNDTDHILEGHI